MDGDSLTIAATAVIAAIVLAVIGYIAAFAGRKGDEENGQVEEDQGEKEQEIVKAPSKAAATARKTKLPSNSATTQFAHRWLVTTLKGERTNFQSLKTCRGYRN